MTVLVIPMVRELILFDGEIFDQAWHKQFLDEGDPLILHVLPDLYFQKFHKQGSKESPGQNDSAQIILSLKTRNQLLSISEQQMNLRDIDYWPLHLSHFITGCHLLRISKEGKALFYGDSTLVFFQYFHQETEDLELARNYLKRYGVMIPQHIPETIFRPSIFQVIQQRFISVGKMKLWQRQQSSLSLEGRSQKELCFSSLFVFQRKFYQKWILTRLLLMAMNTALCFFILFQGLNYKNSLNEIARIDSLLVVLSLEQRHKSYLFSKFQQYHRLSRPVDFQFVHVINYQWKHKVVVTSLDWKPDGTHYAVLFHPDHIHEIESFMDWLEGQHPSIQINQKDTSNGILQLFVTPL